MRMGHVNSVIYSMRLPKIKRTAFHGKNNIWAELGIILDAFISLNLKKMVHYISAIIPLKVEERMIA